MQDAINEYADNFSNRTAAPADYKKNKCCGKNIFVPGAFGFAGLIIPAALCHFVLDVPVLSREGLYIIGCSSLWLSLVGYFCAESCCCNCNRSNKNNRGEDLEPAILPPQQEN